MFRRKGLTVPDAVITFCIALVLLGVIVMKFQRVAQEARRSAVRAELANIRASINLYRLFNGRNPESLRELQEKKVIIPARIGGDRYSTSVIKEKYLMAHAVDEQGNILDAFGNPFEYDSQKGEVRATTEGYETW